MWELAEVVWMRLRDGGWIWIIGAVMVFGLLGRGSWGKGVLGCGCWRGFGGGCLGMGGTWKFGGVDDLEFEDCFVYRRVPGKESERLQWR